MLNTLLNKMGFCTIKSNGNNTIYKSPWNQNENTPSCFVYPSNTEHKDPYKTHNYKDHSTGNGGDIYHFIMTYFNCDFSDAQLRLEMLLEGAYIPTPTVKGECTVKADTNITSIKDIGHNKALTEYLSSRNISNKIAHLGACKEIYYTTNDKRYFAIGFINNNGGYELRNKYFKGNVGGKYVTSFLDNINTDRRLKVFEGFLDFLSYLSMNEQISNYLILNSTALKEVALSKIIKLKNYENIMYELYLDNDKTGNEATQYFIDNLPNVADKREHYKNHNDLNDFWMKSLSR